MNKMLKIAICVVIAIVSFIVITVIGFCLSSVIPYHKQPWVGSDSLLAWANWRYVSTIGTFFITAIVWSLMELRDYLKRKPSNT